MTTVQLVLKTPEQRAAEAALPPGPRNPFRNPVMQSEFRSAVRAYYTKHNDLFRDGQRKTPGSYGSSVATFFWNGFDNVTFGRGWDRESKQMIGYAYWRAGHDIAEMERVADEKRA